MGKAPEKRTSQNHMAEAVTHVSKTLESADMSGDSTPPAGGWPWLGGVGEILQMMPVKGSGRIFENTQNP